MTIAELEGCQDGNDTIKLEMSFMDRMANRIINQNIVSDKSRSGFRVSSFYQQDETYLTRGSKMNYGMVGLSDLFYTRFPMRG